MHKKKFKCLFPCLIYSRHKKFPNQSKENIFSRKITMDETKQSLLWKIHNIWVYFLQKRVRKRTTIYLVMTGTWIKKNIKNHKRKTNLFNSVMIKSQQVADFIELHRFLSSLSPLVCDNHLLNASFQRPTNTLRDACYGRTRLFSNIWKRWVWVDHLYFSTKNLYLVEFLHPGITFVLDYTDKAELIISIIMSHWLELSSLCNFLLLIYHF